MRRTPLACLSTVLALSCAQPEAAVPRPADAAARPATLAERALAQLVVDTSFESFGRPTEGSVLAHMPDAESREPISVWVYRGGALEPAAMEDLDRALFGPRKGWPPYVLVYVVEPESAERLSLELWVRYDMGLTDESRGGYAEKWTLEHRAGRWVVADTETTLHWD